MAKKSRPPVKLHKPAESGTVKVYTLKVVIVSGPVTGSPRTGGAIWPCAIWQREQDQDEE